MSHSATSSVLGSTFRCKENPGTPRVFVQKSSASAGHAKRPKITNANRLLTTGLKTAVRIWPTTMITVPNICRFAPDQQERLPEPEQSARGVSTATKQGEMGSDLNF